MMYSFVLILIFTLGTCVTFTCGCQFLCGIYAECENNVCVCPSDKPLGDPKFFCYEEGQSACHALEDPTVTSFGEARAQLNIPCKYLLAQFDTPVQGGGRRKRSIMIRSFKPGDQEKGRCRIIVEGSNALSKEGMYYLESALVIISVKKKNRVRNVKIEVTSTTVKGLYLGSQYSLNPGEEKSVVILGSKVTAKWDSTTGQIFISAPACDNTQIAFRPFDAESNRQRNRIGVGIVTGSNADFSDKKSKFPFALCDEPAPDGTSSVFKDFAEKVSVGRSDLATLFAFLLATPNTVKQDNKKCYNAQKIFRACQAKRQADAVKQCAPILTTYASCTGYKANRAVEAFKQCLRLICKAPRKPRRLCTKIYRLFIGKKCPGFVIDVCKNI